MELGSTTRLPLVNVVSVLLTVLVGILGSQGVPVSWDITELMERRILPVHVSDKNFFVTQTTTSLALLTLSLFWNGGKCLAQSHS